MISATYCIVASSSIELMYQCYQYVSVPQLGIGHCYHRRVRCHHHVVHIPDPLPGLQGKLMTIHSTYSHCYQAIKPTHGYVINDTTCDQLEHVQHAGERLRRVSQRLHSNRTLSQLMSFIVVTAFILQIQVVMVSIPILPIPRFDLCFT